MGDVPVCVAVSGMNERVAVCCAFVLQHDVDMARVHGVGKHALRLLVPAAEAARMRRKMAFQHREGTSQQQQQGQLDIDAQHTQSGGDRGESPLDDRYDCLLYTSPSPRDRG